jgi:ribosome modulation factor
MRHNPKPMPNPLNRFERIILAMKGRVTTPYDAGYDCGLNGATSDNCHFAYFSNRQRTRAWEQGKADGKIERRRR